MIMRVGAAAILLVSIVAVGTAAAADEPATAPVEQTTGFINGPGMLPQVLRFDSRTLLGWRDVESGLGIIIGAPANPREHVACGGSERSEFMHMQFVGNVEQFAEFDELFKQLAMDQTANVLVYDVLTPTLVESLCGETPAATGVGFFLRSDNDFFGALGRANAASQRVHAQVELTGGGDAVVVASLFFRGAPDGTLESVASSIRLITTPSATG
jgi:hypothetical protein